VTRERKIVVISSLVWFH